MPRWLRVLLIAVHRLIGRLLQRFLDYLRGQRTLL